MHEYLLDTKTTKLDHLFTYTFFPFGFFHSEHDASGEFKSNPQKALEQDTNDDFNIIWIKKLVQYY